MFDPLLLTESGGGGHAVGPGYPWQLVRGGGVSENLGLQLVCEGLNAEKGGSALHFSSIFWTKCAKIENFG